MTMIRLYWAALGLGLCAGVAFMAAMSWRFGYAFEVYQMPLLGLLGGLILAGGLFLLVPVLILQSLKSPAAEQRRILVIILLAGVVMRLLLMPSEPMLEDDYQRYLWDGAVTASGQNPYAVAPQMARAEKAADSKIGQLAARSGKIIERVNHPELRTIYPPVAQAAFAAAYWLKPFSLLAWRGLVLVLELAALGLLLALLKALDRPLIWSALYWWNPVALKELANSTHMEAVLLPLVLAAVYGAVKRRWLAALGATMLAAGAKLWPVLFLPALLMKLRHRPAQLVAGLLLIVVMAGLFAWPVLAAGLDQGSGFVAYAQRWTTNSALFPLLEQASQGLFAAVGLTAHPYLPGLVVRGLIVAGLVLFALWLAWREPVDLTWTFAHLAFAVFLLSPAQFPWYYLWVLPFLCLYPYRGLLLLSALIPLYYANFYYFVTLGEPGFARSLTVALIWLPVWAVLGWEVLSGKGPLGVGALVGAPANRV